MSSKLPSNLNKLSSMDKKLLSKGYDAYIQKGLSNEESFDKACFALGQSSDNLNSSSFSQNINIDVAVAKEGGLFQSNHVIEAVLSSTSLDDQGQQASESLLKWLDTNQRIEEQADIKHKSFNGETNEFNGLFKLISHKMQDSLLKIKFVADKQHNKYKEFLKMNKETPFTGLSAEFFNPKYVGNKIVYASRLGWTLTPKGSNPDAKILK